MAYIIQAWKNKGKLGAIPIDEVHLNHMEAGIAEADTNATQAITKATAVESKIPQDVTPDNPLVDKNTLDLTISESIEEHNEDTNAHLDIREDIPEIVDNVISTNTDKGLSAYQGKLLNDRINNVSQRGRFLSIWNATTGMPLTNPSGYPYEYHTGDYFIVGATGTTNYIPEGDTYEGVPSTLVYTGALKTNDTIYYDDTTWTVLDTPGGGGGGGGNVLDVYQETEEHPEGVSVLSGGVARINAYTMTETDTAIYNAIGLAIESSYPTGGDVNE